jgi:DMSO/TMAO reductase YedYZ molybdopterin-dependent catalytic subunit
MAAIEPAEVGWRSSLAGMLGAAAALATIEVVSLLDATGTSATEAVGNRFIDSFAASLKDLAIALFGTNDKAALQIGTVVVALAIGAVLGRQAPTRPVVVLVGFDLFALLGIWAAANDPLASLWVAALACVAGAVVGSATTLLLDRWWRTRASEAIAADPVTGPAVARRTVLVNAGVFSAILVIGVGVARSAKDSVRATASKAVRQLPRPTRRAEIPADTLDRGAGAIDGISPYITPTDDFYRIDTAQRVPVIDVEDWTLRVTGLVDRELELTYDDLLDRDLIELPITMQCVSNEVGGDLIGTARWIGFPLADLLGEAGVRDGAEQLMTESVDGFTAGFPVADALDGRDALVVVGMNGRPLPPEHGYPVRLVVPGLYGYVSCTKWLSELRLTTWDEEGYWIPRGWAQLGPIKTQSRIDVPRARTEVPAGTVAVAGVAWAPTVGVERVQVRIDGGDWRDATLGPTSSDDTWVQWWWAWDAEPGEHELSVRATDADGETQTAEQAAPAPDGATGHHTVVVTVI